MKFSLTSLIALSLFLLSSSFTPLKFSAKLITSRNLFGAPQENKPTPKKDGGGLFGGMGNMMEAMKKAQEMAKQAEVINRELMDTVVVGQDPSGIILATFNGLGVPMSMKVAEGFQSKSADELSQACTAAMIDGHKRAQAAMMNRMGQMYSDAGVPMPPTQ